MKAIVYTQYGSPDVLNVADVEKPTPKVDEVLVKVHVATVTAGDTRMRSFTVPASYWLPARLVLGVRGPKRQILGMECAGEIEAVGKDVTRFKQGDQVIVSTLEHMGGGYAEYICLPEGGMLAKKSADVSYEEAVTIPVGGRTALYFLREANIRPGQKVLIYGASGSVGTFAVQLAKYYGAEVTGVCSAANLDLVKSLGADAVIDYTQEDFATNGEIYDVIFDTVGKTSYSDCIGSLTSDGAYLHAVSAPGVSLRMKWTSMTSRKRPIGGGPPPKPEDMLFFQDLIAKGKISPVIDRRYPIDNIAEAHRYVDTGRKKGNVIIEVSRGDGPQQTA